MDDQVIELLETIAGRLEEISGQLEQINTSTSYIEGNLSIVQALDDVEEEVRLLRNELRRK